MSRKHISLPDDRQVDAFEAAKNQIEGEVDEIDDYVKPWGDGTTDGEVVRILAKAYQGNLKFS